MARERDTAGDDPGDDGSSGDAQDAGAASRQQAAPDPVTDPSGLAKAHGRYGGYLRSAGLPFEPEELEEEDPSLAERERFSSNAIEEE